MFTQLLLGGLVFTRLIVIVAISPFLGANNLPTVVKSGLALLLTCLVMSMMQTSLPAQLQMTLMVYLGLLLKEALIGFVIAYTASLFLFVVEMAGQLIDIARAANQIQLMVPEQKERSSAFGNLNFQLILVIFFAMNWHVVFFEALFKSFVTLPVFQFPTHILTREAFIDNMLHLVGHVFAAGVGLALPVGLVCLLTDIGFGLINRVAPQINAYFMSLPAKAILGVLVFLLALPYALEEYQRQIEHFLQLLQRALAF